MIGLYKDVFTPDAPGSEVFGDEEGNRTEGTGYNQNQQMPLKLKILAVDEC